MRGKSKTEHGAGPYGDPTVYDILHTPGTAAEVRTLLGIHKQLGGGAARELSVLEPACGTGRLLRPLARRVAQVHGFDLSQEMLSYARRRLPDAQLFRADMEDFAAAIPPGSIHLVINTINTVRHLESDAALQRHFAQVDACLGEDGLYLLGLSLNEYGVDEPSEDQWTARRGRISVHQLIQYIPPPSSAGSDRFEQVYAHLRIVRPGGIEARDHQYRLRSYDRAQWERQLERSSFRCAGIFDDLGRQLHSAAPAYSIFALRRR
jgi:SAM-dependent methyltransferase